jgi:hypothetical protein
MTRYQREIRGLAVSVSWVAAAAVWWVSSVGKAVTHQMFCLA